MERLSEAARSASLSRSTGARGRGEYTCICALSCVPYYTRRTELHSQAGGAERAESGVCLSLRSMLRITPVIACSRPFFNRKKRIV